MLYTISDVKDLFDWNVRLLDSHPLFQRIPNEQLVNFSLRCILGRRATSTWMR